MMLNCKGKQKNIPGSAGCRRIGTAGLCALIALALFMGFPVAAGAHSPKEVVLSYDSAKHMLEVRITHSVKDPASHYIKKVEIKKNGKASSVTEYKSQPGPETFSYSYPLDAAPGDIIEATGTCSIFGSKTGKLTAP
jgi:hypothetical protein